MHQIRFWLKFHPDPAEGVNSVSQTSYLNLWRKAASDGGKGKGDEKRGYLSQSFSSRHQIATDRRTRISCRTSQSIYGDVFTRDVAKNSSSHKKIMQQNDGAHQQTPCVVRSSSAGTSSRECWKRNASWCVAAGNL